MQNPNQPIFDRLTAQKQPTLPVPQPAPPAAHPLSPQARTAAPDPVIQPSRAPGLQTLLEQHGPLPSGSVVLGVCEDGVPLILDLYNPAPGAILITGGESGGAIHLLRAILASAALLNAPDAVSFKVISSDQQGLKTLAQPGSGHSWEAVPPGSYGSRSILKRMTETAQTRRYGSNQGPAAILAIEDLASFVHSLGKDGFHQVFSLIKHGARSRVWVLAVLAAQDAGRLDERLLAAFRTPLLGHAASPELANFLTGDPDLDPGDLQAGVQFFAPFGGEQIRFRVCDVEAPADESAA